METATAVNPKVEMEILLPAPTRVGAGRTRDNSRDKAYAENLRITSNVLKIGDARAFTLADADGSFSPGLVPSFPDKKKAAAEVTRIKKYITLGMSEEDAKAKLQNLKIRFPLYPASHARDRKHSGEFHANGYIIGMMKTG